MRQSETSVEKMGSERFRRIFEKEETAAGVIEVLLILVVLIAIVILFKDQITALADLIFGDMFAKAESIF